jgi:hypothetical protein
MRVGYTKHRVTRGDMGHIRPDRFHNARQVGAEGQWQRLRQSTRTGSDPGVPRPDAGGLDPDKHLSRAGRWRWDVLQRDNVGRPEAMDPARPARGERCSEFGSGRKNVGHDACPSQAECGSTC